MNNIPVFTAEHGIATLILREIPYSGRAYVLIRSIWNGEAEAMLAECRSFCLAVGAEEIYATYEEPLPLPHAYDMLVLGIPVEKLPQPDREVLLEPVSPDNSQDYLDVYRPCFRTVLGAAGYTKSDVEKLYGKDCAFLTRIDGKPAGIAELGEEELNAVAVLPQYRGLGFSLTVTVLRRLTVPMAKLIVCSTNEKAVDLYDRIGFTVKETKSRWFRLL